MLENVGKYSISLTYFNAKFHSKLVVLLIENLRFLKSLSYVKVYEVAGKKLLR